MADGSATPVRVAVAATAVDGVEPSVLAGVTSDDLVVTGYFDLPEPPDADLRRAVRARPELAHRQAAEAVADGRAEVLVADAHPFLTAAAATFVWGTQRGVTRAVIAALLPRPDGSVVVLVDLAADTDADVALALGAALAQSLDLPGGVAELGPTASLSLVAALANSSVGVVVAPEGVARGIVEGWTAAGGSEPLIALLGLPYEAIVGPVAHAAPLARALHRKQLVGYSAKALADLVTQRRAAAGLDR